MVMKKVKICDICNDRLAKDKCFICNKDICDYCDLYVSLIVKKKSEYSDNIDSLCVDIGSGKTKDSIKICKECKEKWIDTFLIIEDNKSKNKNLLIDILDLVREHAIVSAI